MQTTRITVVAIGVAAMCVAGLTAQTQETTTTTKTKIDNLTLTDVAGVRPDEPISSLDDTRLHLPPDVRPRDPHAPGDLPDPQRLTRLAGGGRLRGRGWEVPRMVRAMGSHAVSSAIISATASQLLRFVAPGAIVNVLRASTAVTTSAGMHSTRSTVRPTTASTHPRR